MAPALNEDLNLGCPWFWISYLHTPSDCPWRKDMLFHRIFAHDVHGLDPAHNERIGDERPVAAPGECLGAQEGRPLLFRNFQQLA